MAEPLAIVVSTEWRRNPIRTVSKRRVCLHEDCQTVLSRYNPRKMCSIHERKPLLDLPRLA